MQECSISPDSKKSPIHTPPLAAVAKALIVDALGIILAWRPTLAMVLGKVVTVLWPGFWRAWR
jgi:hypothetical protein